MLTYLTLKNSIELTLEHFQNKKNVQYTQSNKNIG